MTNEITEKQPTMSGPENYETALRELSYAADCVPGSDMERRYLARAQVHATLAQAAATALCNVTEQTPMDEYRAWRRVAGGVR